MLAAAIRAYEQEGQTVFEPDALQAMSRAFDDICTVLQIPMDRERERRVIATRIIDLARTGVIDATALRDRILLEAGSHT
jgi:hypothetical protein